MVNTIDDEAAADAMRPRAARFEAVRRVFTVAASAAVAAMATGRKRACQLRSAYCWLSRSLSAWNRGRLGVGHDAGSLGDLGERIAARYLRSQGLRIIARQVRNTLGEIDLIAVDGRTIVFVEVKTRRSDALGHPLESVTAQKQEKLTRLALAYLRRNDLLECAARFDVVAITLPEDDSTPEIEYVRNAFEPTQSFQWFG